MYHVLLKNPNGWHSVGSYVLLYFILLPLCLLVILPDLLLSLHPYAFPLSHCLILSKCTVNTSISYFLLSYCPTVLLFHFLRVPLSYVSRIMISMSHYLTVLQPAYGRVTLVVLCVPHIYMYPLYAMPC